MTWSETLYLGKAKTYIERGLEAEDEAVRAWWIHFSIEPLIRAAVASVHPALLADPRHVDSLLLAVGVTEHADTITRSRGLKELVEIAQQISILDGEAGRCAARLLLRRNEECHGPAAALESVRDSEWLPDFLRVAASCAATLSIELGAIVGQGYAAHARDLAEQSRADTEATVQRLIAEARKRDKLDPPPSAGWSLVEQSSGEVFWVQTCPACGAEGQMEGARVHVGGPRFDGEELTRPVTVAARRFSCPTCRLELTGQLQLSAAGLPATTRHSDWVDPYDALQLDPAEEAEARGLQVIDPSDFEYMDE